MKKIDVSRVPTPDQIAAGESETDADIDFARQVVGAVVDYLRAGSKGVFSPNKGDVRLSAGALAVANRALAEKRWQVSDVSGADSGGACVAYKLLPLTANRVEASGHSHAPVDVSRVPEKFGVPVRVGPVQHLVDQVVRYLETGDRFRHRLELADENNVPATADMLDLLNVALTPTPWRVRTGVGPQGAAVYVLDPAERGAR